MTLISWPNLPAIPAHWLYAGGLALMVLYALFMWGATVFRRKRTVNLTYSPALDELNMRLDRIASALERLAEAQHRPASETPSAGKHSIPLSMFGREH